MDRLIDETESELSSEEADRSERGQILAAATRLINKLRRMLHSLEESESDE